jgi:hypothetical protein
VAEDVLGVKTSRESSEDASGAGIPERTTLTDNPYPAMIMNQTREDGLPSGRFGCILTGCRWEGDSYDQLATHVTDVHQIALLRATLDGLAKYREASPGLREWLVEGLNGDEVRRQAPVVRLNR